jgi:hypothetical protein
MIIAIPKINKDVPYQRVNLQYPWEPGGVHAKGAAEGYQQSGGPLITVPDHDGGRPMEVNACILITHMVYL